MASGTVAVRLPDEVLEQLQTRATAENKKVSDLVRELIISGLQQREKPDGATPAMTGRLDRLEALGDRATKAALKAQFLANMSASYAVDVARLMSGGGKPSTDEKQEFMAQMDSWAENFADGEMRKTGRTE